MSEPRSAAIRTKFAVSCLLAGLVAGVQQYVVVRSVNPHASVIGAAGPHVLSWFGWAVLLPLVVRVNARIARLRIGLPARAAVFLCAASLFAVVDIAAMFAVRAPAASVFGGERVDFASLLRGWFLLGIVGYAVVSATWVAVDQWRVARARELAAAQLAEELARARLSALQAQLRPHFLFNTMNAIAMLCRMGDSDRAVDMLVGVTEVLRELLDDREGSEVPLGKELRSLSRYVAIEEIRFGDRLRVDVDVPAELHALLVPRLILQPLVENAIRHGIAPRAGNGQVRVIGRRRESQFVIRVEDDGIGFDPSATDGVGLSNTRARLRHLYGDAGALQLSRRSGGGTIVDIELPCHLTSWPMDTIAHSDAAVFV